MGAGVGGAGTVCGLLMQFEGRMGVIDTSETAVGQVGKTPQSIIATKSSNNVLLRTTVVDVYKMNYL